jgi:hypothetical protein
MSVTAADVAAGEDVAVVGPVCASCASAAEPMASGNRKATFLMLDIVTDRSLSVGERV